MDAAALLRWYGRWGRDLPWRRTRDPYRVLVSEVMLQQTQVSRVEPRYGRFLARFPDEHALAGSGAAEVIEEWSGLGYNRRALAVREAARAVVRDGWPGDAAGLERLPGVGPYTAAAVASFAFDEQVPAIDTNLRRSISRWDGVRRGPAALAARAENLLPPGRAAAWNHAMMDLGATICRPRAPRCGECPVRDGCATRTGSSLSLPPVSTGSGRGVAKKDSTPFEESDRYVRGRVVAALVRGDALPGDVGEERLERAVAGLERDGLVVRRGARVALPGR